MHKYRIKGLILVALSLISSPLFAIYSTALMNLKPLDIDSIGFDGDIQYALRSSLDKRSEVNIMTRREMESELFNQGIAIGSSFDDAIVSGRSLGVEFVIYGDVMMSEAGIKSNISLVDIKNARLAKKWELTFTGRTEINEKGPLLADTLIKAMAVSVKEAANLAAAKAAMPVIKEKLLQNFTSKSVETGISVEWQASKPETINLYNLYRSNNQHGPFTQIAQVESNSYLDSQVEDKQTYFYKLAVVLKETNKQAEDVSITEVKFKDLRQVNRPFTPTILNVETLVRSAEITFVPNLDNPANNHLIQKYKIYRLKAGLSNWLHVGTIKINTKEPKLSYVYKDKNNIEDGASYSYAVSAVNQLGKESKLSGTEIFISPSTPVLSVAKDLQLREVELAWQIESASGGFYIYRRQKGTTIWQRIGAVKQNTIRGFIDRKDLKDDTQYEYYISLYNKGQETEPSNIVTATTKGLPARAEALSAESDLVKSVKLTWQKMDDADVAGYKLYRMEDDGDGFQEGDQLTLVHTINGGTTTEFTDTGTNGNTLKDGTTYHYAIAAMNKFSARGELSFIATATTKSLPKAVETLTAIGQSGSIALQWSEPLSQDIKYFHLYRKWDKQNWRAIAKLTVESRSYADSDLKPYAQTQYKLVAEDNSGLLSADVLSESITSPAELSLKLEADNLLRKITISWQAQKNITGYKIYRKQVAQASWKNIKTFESSDVSRYTDTEVFDGIQYEYKLTAIDGYLETPSSNIILAKTKPLPNPPMEFKAASGLVKQVNLSWKPSTDPDIAGYHIYRIDGNEADKIETIDHRKISKFTDKGSLFSSLKDGREYGYRISAFNKFEAEGLRSEIITATTKSLPDSVKQLTLNYTQSTIQVSWAANLEADITQYILERSTGKSCLLWRGVTKTAEVQFVDTDVKAGEFYCYRVKAKDKDNLESEKWAEASLSTQ